VISKNPLINKKAVSVLLAGMAFLFFSCQSVPERIKGTPAERPAQNEYSKAIGDYKEGRYEKAITSLSILLKGTPGHPEASIIKYYLASSLFYTEKYQDAVTLSIEWLRQYPDNTERYKVQRLLGDSSRRLGQLFDACFWMLKSHESAINFKVSKSERDDISNSIIEIINECNVEDLNKILKLAKTAPYHPDIHHRLANIYLEKGNLFKARQSAMQIFEVTDGQNWKSTGQQLLSVINKRIEIRGDIKRNAIGCLLPLKGYYSLFGEELLKGIQIGMKIFQSRGIVEPIELIIKNTDGSEEATLSAIDDLVNNEKVIAIIGPLASVPSAAAAKKAQASGVPIITFSQRQKITEEGDMVFRNFLTPSKEVDIILNKAVNDMGMTRFGIFYPDKEYGRFFMNLFWDKVEEMGGEVTAVESYQPGDTDFAVGIKKMVGLYYPRPESVKEMLKEMKQTEGIEGFKLEEIIVAPEQQPFLEIGELADLLLDDVIMEETVNDEALNDDELAEVEQENEEEEEPEPIVDFDAVFIPDNSQNIAQIAPQFPYNNVFNVPYLGTRQWMSDELIKTTSNYIQGAIFPTGFYINRDSTEISEFVRLYNENYGENPGVLAANGYDTIKMIKYILSNSEIITRSDFQKSLMVTNDYIGTTGNISFDENGEVEKDPILLTVHGRRLHIMQLNPTPPEKPESLTIDDVTGKITQ